MPFRSVFSIRPIYLEEAPILGKHYSGIPNNLINFELKNTPIFIFHIKEYEYSSKRYEKH